MLCILRRGGLGYKFGQGKLVKLRVNDPKKEALVTNIYIYI